MKLIKTFFVIIIIFFALFFLQINDSKVNVDLLFRSFQSISVSSVILVSVAIGIIIGYLISIFSILTTKSKIRKVENKNLRLIEELNSLRNIAIDEDILSKDVD
mgnify:CR=1 FL=1